MESLIRPDPEALERAGGRNVSRSQHRSHSPGTGSL